VRELLLVSYHVPPRPGVAKTRTQQLLKYLPAYGWNVTAVTAELEGAPPGVIQTDYVDLGTAFKRMIGLRERSVHELLKTTPAAYGARRSALQRALMFAIRASSYPDPQIGWFLPGRRALRALLAHRRFDAILSSAPPFTTNVMIGSLRPKAPWIADFRDLWTDGDAYGSRLRRLCDGPLEHWSLREVAALTTLSDPMAASLRARHPGVRVDVIPNAFDADEWSAIPFESNSRCTILYAGQLFGGRRDPRPLFRAVRSLMSEGSIQPDDLRIDFYAPVEPWLAKAIEEHGLRGVVRVHGLIPRDRILAEERRADRLLVLLWSGAGSEGIVTGKIFEYLGARRRVLAIGGPNRSAVDELLAQSDAGTRVTDESSLRRELLDAIDEHRRGATRILDAARLAPYEATTIVRQFAELLDAVSWSDARTVASYSVSSVPS
jgi:glycosyltransferase involved in cell wall biosynthesis